MFLQFIENMRSRVPDARSTRSMLSDIVSYWMTWANEGYCLSHVLPAPLSDMRQISVSRTCPLSYYFSCVSKEVLIGDRRPSVDLRWRVIDIGHAVALFSAQRERWRKRERDSLSKSEDDKSLDGRDIDIFSCVNCERRSDRAFYCQDQPLLAN